MVYQMAAMTVTLNDLEGHLWLTDVFKCNPSDIRAAFCTISTDSVLACFLCISRASCQQLSQKTAIVFQLTQHVARFLCNSRVSCHKLCQSRCKSQNGRQNAQILESLGCCLSTAKLKSVTSRLHGSSFINFVSQ